MTNMPREVRTLQSLAIDAVSTYIQTVAEKFLDLDRVISNDIFELYMESYLKTTNQRFRFAVPWNLYQEVVGAVLQAIYRLTMGKIEREEEICWRFSEVFMNAKLKWLPEDFMSESLRPIVWKNMNLMTGLEEISFGDQAIIADQAITDDLISNLRKCPTLRKIRIRSSPEGCAKLLLGLPYLEDIYMYEEVELGEVLDVVQKSGEFKEPFGFKEVYLPYPTTKQLGLLDKMCPMISELVVDLNFNSVTDLGVVKTLDRLTDVSLENFKFHEMGVDKFLELHGFKIIRLSLGTSESINLDALMHIDRSCPNLKDLYLDGIHSVHTFEFSTVKRFPLFKHLENLSLYDWSGLDRLVEFILSGCINVEYLLIKQCVANESTIMRALAINPMNKLKHLQIESSMTTCIKIFRDRNCELKVIVLRD